MMPSRSIAALILVCLTSMSPAEEPKKDAKDAGRDLRNMFLTITPEKAGIEPCGDYPRVFAIAMDWPIG